MPYVFYERLNITIFLLSSLNHFLTNQEDR